MDGVTEHIAEAQASGAVTDEATLRTLLDRLGEPVDIVASARAEDGDPPARYLPAPAARTGRETAAVLLMTAGSIIPFFGWLAGVVLMWSSTRWTRAEKIMGTIVVPGGPFAALWVVGTFTVGTATTCTSQQVAVPAGTAPDIDQSCSSSGSSGVTGAVIVALLIAWIVVSVVVGVVLLRRAYRRAEAERLPVSG